MCTIKQLGEQHNVIERQATSINVLNQNIKIFNQNCFDFLKTIKEKSVDLFLIDPPYQISKETGFSKGSDKFSHISFDFGEWDNSFTGIDIVAKDAFKALRKGGTIVCFYDLWKITELKEALEKAGFKQIRFIEWIKTNPVPINSKVNYLTGAREIALVAVKGGKGTFKSKYDNGIYEYPIYQGKDRFHTTQKPIKLIEEILLKHSNENDLVVDCFSGSGTTALTCLMNNRRFIGCELDKDYFEKSIDRINEVILKN